MTSKILIVDDEPAIRENLEVGLQARGFETILASNGEDAVTLALRNQPDLILLDVMMPKADGMSVCKRLKTLIGDFVPIIMVTGMDDVANKSQGVQQGADDYVTKPFKIDELMTRISAMLRIKSQHDGLKKISNTDYLTGIANRRNLLACLSEECARAKRSGSRLSCLMLDLDDFKTINDGYGHPFGDHVLKEVVTLVKELVGASDLFARYGGDEFVLVLPDTPIESATSMAEVIRKIIEKHEFRHGEHVVQLTCSIGVCGFPDANLNEMNDLIDAMDEMLYSSKQKGRNKVTVQNWS